MRHLVVMSVFFAVLPIIPCWALEPPQPRDICNITGVVKAVGDHPSWEGADGVTYYAKEITLEITSSYIQDKRAEGPVAQSRCMADRMGKTELFKQCDRSMKLEVGDAVKGKEGSAFGPGRYCLFDAVIVSKQNK